MKRNRVKPTFEWINVPNVPFDGDIPPLPETPREIAEQVEPPEPERPLGRMGLAMWNRIWSSSNGLPVDREGLLLLCEQMDERVQLRFRVLKGEDRCRNALRQVDQQIMVGLNALSLSLAARAIPTRWPKATLRWWGVVSRMPHCILWEQGDWDFALDTASVAAAFHMGDVRYAIELRQRERIMGVTGDARRDLRIRYVDPAVQDQADPAIVTVMDAYRRAASGE